MPHLVIYDINLIENIFLFIKYYSMQAAPQNVTIGLAREGLHEFDDLKELEKHPGPYRIHEIEGIISISFKSNTPTIIFLAPFSSTRLEMENTLKDTTLKNSSLLDISSESFTRSTSRLMTVSFLPYYLDDELLEISGYAGARVNHLAFKTYKGVHEGYGPKEGVHFEY